MNQVPQTESFVDRRTRLIVLGVLATLSGMAWAGLAALMLVLPLINDRLPSSGATATNPKALAVQTFVLLSLAIALVWLGLGSLRARRWVRPLMLILCWTWLLSGAASLPLIYLMLDPLILESAPDAPPEVRAFARWFAMAVCTSLGVLLPAVLVWGYTDRNVASTAEAVDPTPAWTERCPLTVLGLSLGLAGGAYLSLPSAIYAVMPFFGRLWTGWPAVLLTLAGGALCLWLARATFALQPAGWWGALALFAVLGVSTTLTFLRVDLIELYREIGYPEQQLRIMEQNPVIHPSLLATMMAVLTLAGVGYMLAVRKHFFDGTG